jgi:hypothetical protein
MENQRSQKLRQFTSVIKATNDLLPFSFLAPDDQIIDAPVTWLPPIGSPSFKQGQLTFIYFFYLTHF